MKKIIEIKGLHCEDFTTDTYNVKMKLEKCVPVTNTVNGVRTVKETNEIKLAIGAFIARTIANEPILGTIHQYMKVQARRNEKVIWDIDEYLGCIESIDISYNEVTMSDTYKVADKELHYENNGYDISIIGVKLYDDIVETAKNINTIKAKNRATNFANAGL